jgi:aldose 1-epimerase
MDCREDRVAELPDGRPVTRFTLANAAGVTVRLTDYGARVVGVEMPDRAGNVADIVLGHDTLDGWRRDTAYFGATVGRYANRIGGARFTLDGRAYVLTANEGPNQLHGGRHGFDQVAWDAAPVQCDDAVGVMLSYLSRAGEEGFPGNLQATVTYWLTRANVLAVVFAATTDAPTVVNLAHHSYWNLAGHAAGSVADHELLIEADAYTPTDDALIPTGALAPVAGTPLDFTQPRRIGDGLAQQPAGYDHNFVLRGSAGTLRRAARLVAPTSGRALEVFTDQPGMQFYTANHLDGSTEGKGGAVYARHGGLCLETQHFPDSPNRPAFPSTVLRPSETYRHVMEHRLAW